MKNLYIACISVFLFSSCRTTVGYSSFDQNHFHFEESYNVSDTLFITDYVCRGIDRNSHDRQIALNADSLFHIFKTSFAKLDLPVSFSTSPENRKSVHDVNLKSIDSNKTIVVPIITKTFSHDGSDMWFGYNCWFHLTIVIFKNEKIIYYKRMSHSESIKDEDLRRYKHEDFHIPIPQKHWDNLVRDVMREYLERLVWQG